jgi:hypothetical protein
MARQIQLKKEITQLQLLKENSHQLVTLESYRVPLHNNKHLQK